MIKYAGIFMLTIPLTYIIGMIAWWTIDNMGYLVKRKQIIIIFIITAVVVAWTLLAVRMNIIMET